jgi:hypothetical protein
MTFKNSHRNGKAMNYRATLIACTALLALSGFCRAAEATGQEAPAGPVQTVRETAVKVGHAARDGAIQVGHDARVVAGEVAHAAVEVGHATRDTAVKAGHAIKGSAKEIARTVKPSGQPAHPAPVVDAPPATPVVVAPHGRD